MRVGEFELTPLDVDRDAAFVADVDTEVRRDDPEDPVLLRHWWTLMAADAIVTRYIVSLGGERVGYAFVRHLPWERMPERFASAGCELRPKVRTEGRLGALQGHLESDLVREGAKKVTSWAWDYDAVRIAMLGARGYREERRQRFWELDLVRNRERIERTAAESRERMKKEGIRVLTLEQDHDPKRWEKLKRMSDEAEDDVPTTVPHVPMAMSEWMKWFESPGLRPDRIWLAREGDDIVGISQLSYPPVRGVVATDWTGTARKVRGRGVARALKCETLMQAIALGVDRVRTDNDSANAPILHINETMGYRIRCEGIQFLKEL